MAEPFHWVGRGGLLLNRPSILAGDGPRIFREQLGSAKQDIAPSRDVQKPELRGPLQEVEEQRAPEIPTCPSGECGDVVAQTCEGAGDEAACKTDLAKALAESVKAGEDDAALERRLREVAQRHRLAL